MRSSVLLSLSLFVLSCTDEQKPPLVVGWGDVLQACQEDEVAAHARFSKHTIKITGPLANKWSVGDKAVVVLGTDLRDVRLRGLSLDQAATLKNGDTLSASCNWDGCTDMHAFLTKCTVD